MWPKTNPWSELAIQMGRLYLDSSYVIARRTGDMARGRFTTDEWTQMMSEKPIAFMSAVQLGSGAILTGGHPAEVARAAMRPLNRHAGQNAQRLSRR